MITITSADARNPYDSKRIFVGREESIQCEEDGSCYCHPASPTGRPTVHDHLKVWGEEPEAAPRYYAVESL